MAANTETDTLLTGKVETPKRALALKLGLALCGLAALVSVLATPSASDPGSRRPRLESRRRPVPSLPSLSPHPVP